VTAPTVSQYGPRTNGERAAHFSVTVNGAKLDVQVIPGDVDDNNVALNVAHDLANQAEALQRRSDEIAKLEKHAEMLAREIRVLNGRVPPDAPTRLLGVGYVRFHGLDNDKKPWLFGKRERGWAEFGVRCDSWDDLFRRYDVRVTGYGEDEHGPWWSVENGERR